MIRILQQDNRITKIIFAVIIGAAIVTMVITLVPGIYDNATANSAGVYATVREPGLMGKIGGTPIQIKSTDVAQMAERMYNEQHYPPQYAQMLMPMMQSRAAQVLVQKAMLKQEADRMGLQVSDADLQRELKTGVWAQYLFPGGEFIGDEKYTDFVANAFRTTRADFEDKVKEDLELNRLQALITGGVTVSDNAVRESYRVSGTKVKFDYAVVSSDDLAKTINASDAELENFFKQNAARYATAVPETRKVEYVAFDASSLSGGRPAVSDAEVAAYYNAHQDSYKVEEQVKTRHILVTSPKGADAKTDAAAKAKAEDILKQLKAGGNFAELAKKNSDDPGSKETGGELPMIATSGLDPAYARAAMALSPGQTSDLVKSQFGYHIIQTEEKQTAHLKPLAEVAATIKPMVEQQKASQALQGFAQQLASEAAKSGLDKTAAAHGLHAVTTDYLAPTGVIAGLADGSALLAQAFQAKAGAAPATVSTGDGMALYRVVDVKAAHAPAFADWKSHVADDYKAQRVPQLLNEKLAKLADRAKTLQDLKKAAAELNVPVKSSDLVGKDGSVADVGAMTGPASVAFTLPKGGVSGPLNTGRTGVVLEVTDKQEPAAEEIAKNFEKTRDELVNEQRAEIFRVYLGTLSAKYEKSGAVRLTAAPKGKPGAPAAPGDNPFGN